MNAGAPTRADASGDWVRVEGNLPPSGASLIWYEVDGRRLRMLYAPAAGTSARALAVVCPGRTEFIEKYFEVMRDLQARGFACVCFDWPGQGLSDRLLKDPLPGHIVRFDSYVRALKAGLDLIAPRPPAARVLVAHSMGGAIALEAMRSGQIDARLAAFSAPMWGLPVSPPLQIYARLARALGFGAVRAQPEAGEEVFEGNTLTHDAERWRLYRRLIAAEPRLRLGQPTIGWVVAALDVCAGFFRPGALERLKACPMLIASASEEALTDPSAAARIASRLPAARHLCVEGALHEILMETDERRAVWLSAFDQLCADNHI